MSPDAWGLLLGAPALTETGLAPAGDEQREADGPLSASPRRTMRADFTAARAARASAPASSEVPRHRARSRTDTRFRGSSQIVSAVSRISRARQVLARRATACRCVL